MRISAGGKTLSGLRSTLVRENGWIIMVDCGNGEIVRFRVPKHLAANQKFDRLQREATEEAIDGNA